MEDFEAIKKSIRDEIENRRLDFERENNPIFVWRAIYFACIYGGEFPEWIMNYLAKTAEAIVDLNENFKEGEGAEEEAKFAGQALGFVAVGRGGTTYAERASILQRDQYLHSLVKCDLEKGDKLSIARENVADRTGWPLTLVKRAYKNIESTKREAPSKALS